MDIQTFCNLLGLAIEQAELYWYESGMNDDHCDMGNYQEECQLNFEDGYQISILDWS